MPFRTYINILQKYFHSITCLALLHLDVNDVGDERGEENEEQQEKESDEEINAKSYSTTPVMEYAEQDETNENFNMTTIKPSLS